MGKISPFPWGPDNHTVYVPSIITLPQKDTIKSITLPWSTGEKKEKFYTNFMSIPLNSAATDTHTHTQRADQAQRLIENYKLLKSHRK